MSEFDTWAKYYDLIHQGLEGEAEFYVGQAARRKSRTLELGCGTGRIAIPMAMSGCEVVGVDVSEEMLRVARRKAAGVGRMEGRLNLIQGDMTSLPLSGHFDLIVAPYRTMMHLLEAEDQLRCLAGVWDLLGPQGKFIFNVWTPHFRLPELRQAETPLRGVGVYDIPGTGESLAHYYRCSYDLVQQLMREEHVIHTLNEEEVIVGEEKLAITRTWYTKREMDALLWGSGLRTVALFGDFSCGSVDREKPELVYVVERG